MGQRQQRSDSVPWFAKRPLAQARAAVLTSVLPWPEDTAEQVRLQDLVRRAMRDYGSAQAEVLDELGRLDSPPSVLDIFSGRAMIPLEAARYGITAFGIDYPPEAQ